MSAATSKIGERLKAVRLRAGLSHERFSTLLGFSKRTLMNWEQGVSKPPISILPKLREMFNVDPEWLVMGKDTIPRSSFKPMNWRRLERLERDVRCACWDSHLNLSPAQLTELVRSLYDDGPDLDKVNRAKLPEILIELTRERG
ncbi:helix-turn-helix domain-containing protein [Paenirhodobacter populi]|uniref:XRE family transcriptional regulator n=1 Tax=Paenirhodobacter populi TaxID=2306993 RepID=A0A443K4A1_9RHOB|nr:XRE family transcriptional regulator [Sinirhodobacter populi]RWR04339.1 XRE family transcriptional regulator [Sinirhodobacter populi]RWR16868.1 XRE family transcriptional regulator [Sinirhodobacter populi]RWR25428.1 XRE family transcriptional regulator [Sinirhodobacter populi]RWR27523.1 XRE family transcriptional regulator [Sinirhodobacter populi]